ncbi:MAG: YicC family protein [Lachnospiraceae bacterium]|nr:YicC family protein [Lachnospiraceae bacterium]
MKIRSMTGFGHAESETGSRKFTVEVKAVNHRFLEVGIRSPKVFNIFEASIRSTIKEYISRGKVDVFITFEDNSENSGHVRYNSNLAREYLEHIRSISGEFGLKNDISAVALSRFPDVFTTQDMSIDEDELWKELEAVLRQALQNHVGTRETEGENLRSDIIEKLDGMLNNVLVIEKNSPQIVEEYRKKLRAKVAELIDDSQIDEARLTTEVVIYADKICVDEEIVRLKSHIESMKQTLKDGGSCGRRLDFIAQEMNREANTTLSKAGDLITSDIAIDLKTDIEKVREQIQNIE